jgi:hypothetical protein
VKKLVTVRFKARSQNKNIPFLPASRKLCVVFILNKFNGSYRSDGAYLIAEETEFNYFRLLYEDEIEFIKNDDWNMPLSEIYLDVTPATDEQVAFYNKDARRLKLLSSLENTRG